LRSGTKIIEIQLEKPSPGIDLWSNRAASWAQVLTFFVVVVGYFYTVVPAFQKERLSEEVARLEIERERSITNIDHIKASASRMQLVLDNMKASRDRLQTENSNLLARQRALMASASEADGQRREANRRLAVEKKRLKETNDVYLKAVKDRFALDFQMSLFPILDNGIDFSKAKSQQELASRIRDGFSDPIGKIDKIIDDMSEGDAGSGQVDSVASMAFKRVSDEFQASYKGRKKNVVIAPINGDLWAAAYFDQLAKAKAGELQCVNAYWTGLAKAKKWTKAQLNQLQHDAAYGPKQSLVFQRTCSVMAEYSILSSFMKAWGDYMQEYVRRLSSVPQAVMDDVPMKPFPSNLVQPPKFQGPWAPSKDDLQFQE